MNVNRTLPRDIRPNNVCHPQYYQSLHRCLRELREFRSCLPTNVHERTNRIVQTRQRRVQVTRNDHRRPVPYKVNVNRLIKGRDHLLRSRKRTNDRLDSSVPVNVKGGRLLLDTNRDRVRRPRVLHLLIRRTHQPGPRGKRQSVPVPTLLVRRLRASATPVVRRRLTLNVIIIALAGRPHWGRRQMFRSFKTIRNRRPRTLKLNQRRLRSSFFLLRNISRKRGNKRATGLALLGTANRLIRTIRILRAVFTTNLNNRCHLRANVNRRPLRRTIDQRTRHRHPMTNRVHYRYHTLYHRLEVHLPVRRTRDHVRQHDLTTITTDRPRPYCLIENRTVRKERRSNNRLSLPRKVVGNTRRHRNNRSLPNMRGVLTFVNRRQSTTPRRLVLVRLRINTITRRSAGVPMNGQPALTVVRRLNLPTRPPSTLNCRPHLNHLLKRLFFLVLPPIC